MRQTLFVRGNYQEDNIGQVPTVPDAPAPSIWYHPKGFALGHSWTVSNRMVNRFTYGLTRAAFTRQGDQTWQQRSVSFHLQPAIDDGLTRVTPVHNLVDDVTYVKGNHTLQFGGNVRLIKNKRESFANAFDTLTTNPSGYAASAAVLTAAGADGFWCSDLFECCRQLIDAAPQCILSLSSVASLNTPETSVTIKQENSWGLELQPIEHLLLRNTKCTGRINGAASEPDADVRSALGNFNSSL
jgi:hypothetical protein